MSMKRRWLRTRRCSTRSSKIVWCQRWSALKANLTPRSTQASTHTCTTIIWLRQGRKKEKKYSLRGKKTLWGTPPKMRLSETSVVPSQLLAPSQNLESSTKSAIWEKLSSRTWLWIRLLAGWHLKSCGPLNRHAISRIKEVNMIDKVVSRVAVDQDGDKMMSVMVLAKIVVTID